MHVRSVLFNVVCYCDLTKKNVFFFFVNRKMGEREHLVFCFYFEDMNGPRCLCLERFDYFHGRFWFSYFHPEKLRPR